MRIAGINWYGFETTDEVAHGLWARTTTPSSTTSRAWDTTRSGSPSPTRWSRTRSSPAGISYYNSTGPINTDLKGLNSLADPAEDRRLRRAGRAEGDPRRPPLRGRQQRRGERPVVHEHVHQPGLDRRLDDIATMFANNPTVIGFDLRNEPHTPAGDTYAQGATWGTGDPSTDVRLATRRPVTRSWRTRTRWSSARASASSPTRPRPPATTRPGGAVTSRAWRNTRSCSAPRGTSCTRPTTTARTNTSRPGSTPRRRRRAWTRYGPSTGATSRSRASPRCGSASSAPETSPRTCRTRPPDRRASGSPAWSPTSRRTT